MTPVHCTAAVEACEHAICLYLKYKWFKIFHHPNYFVLNRRYIVLNDNQLSVMCTTHGERRLNQYPVPEGMCGKQTGKRILFQLGHIKLILCQIDH